MLEQLLRKELWKSSFLSSKTFHKKVNSRALKRNSGEWGWFSEPVGRAAPSWKPGPKHTQSAGVFSCGTEWDQGLSASSLPTAAQWSCFPFSPCYLVIDVVYLKDCFKPWGILALYLTAATAVPPIKNSTLSTPWSMERETCYVLQFIKCLETPVICICKQKLGFQYVLLCINTR